MTSSQVDTILMSWRSCSLHFQERRIFYTEDVGSRFLQNTGNNIPDFIVSHPTIQSPSVTAMGTWKSTQYSPPCGEATLIVSTWRWRKQVIAQGDIIFILSTLRPHTIRMTGYCSLWAVRRGVGILHMPSFVSARNRGFNLWAEKSQHRCDWGSNSVPFEWQPSISP